MQHTRFLVLFVALVFAALLSSCGPGSDGGTTADAEQATSSVAAPNAATATPLDSPQSSSSADSIYEVPGLPGDTHVGIAAFSPPGPSQAEAWQQRWDEANEKATIGRVQLDWIDVEPVEGDYRLDDVSEQLDEVSGRGQLPMMSIIAVDVSGTTWPEWLADTDPETAAAAYNRMLDAVLPMLQEHGVWLLSIANEPPFEDGVDPADFGRFLSLVRAHGETTAPDLEITFTFAGDSYLTNDAIGELVQLVDVVAVNHYCLQADLTVTDLSDTATELDKLISGAAGRPVVFQELGCPAGELLGSSDEFQAAWFTAAFAWIEDDPSVRAAFVFEFSDWSADLVNANYGEAIAAEPALADFFARFEDWLLTTGLVRNDMTTRPAWQVYLDQLGS